MPLFMHLQQLMRKIVFRLFLTAFPPKGYTWLTFRVDNKLQCVQIKLIMIRHVRPQNMICKYREHLRHPFENLVCVSR